MNYNDGIEIVVADSSHEKYVDTILETITASAKKRGSGIATRTHEYLTTKMRERKAIIALSGPERNLPASAILKVGVTRNMLPILV